MSNPSTSWTAQRDGSGQWDNHMAAQHLPRDLVHPSSGYEELTQKKKKTVSNKVYTRSWKGWEHFKTLGLTNSLNIVMYLKFKESFWNAYLGCFKIETEWQILYSTAKFTIFCLFSPELQGIQLIASRK